MKSMPRMTGRFVLLAAALSLGAPGPALAFCDHFRRGDSNDDGKVDLSDSLATLLFLFAGGLKPGCEDAADADDSGKLDVSDAIYALGFLFLGTAPPSAPGPFVCGPDPTFDDLTCVAQAACAPEPTPTDFSGFARFEYHQDPAFGFCPEIDKVFSASIQKSAEGAYHVEMAVLREGDPASDECIEPRRNSCLVADPLPPRDLDPEEVSRVDKVFRRVLVFNSPDTICLCVAIDPCRISRFTWDAVEVSGFECQAPRMDEPQQSAMLDLLESLRAQ